MRGQWYLCIALSEGLQHVKNAILEQYPEIYLQSFKVLVLPVARNTNQLPRVEQLLCMEEFGRNVFVVWHTS